MCVFPHLYKTEMKGGARLSEQLPGFHSVSADLRSRSPQPLFTSSSDSPVPWVAGETQRGSLYDGWKDTAEPSARNPGNRTARFEQGCFAE